MPNLYRRIVSISLLFVTYFLLLALLPLTLLLAALIDVFRKKRWATVRFAVFLFLYFTFDVAGVFGLFGVWLISKGERFFWLSFAQQKWWSLGMWNASKHIYNMHVTVEGEESVLPGPIVLFMRHSSVADTLISSVLVAAKHNLPLRYVIKQELLWDPCIDICAQRLGCTFVERGGRRREQEIEKVAQLVDGLTGNSGVAIYPEGTRFTEKKKQRILEKLKEQGLMQRYQFAKGLKHSLPPRHGGTLSLLERNQLVDVVFCAHVGFEKVSTIGDMINGALIDQHISIKFWRVKRANIPQGHEERAAWLNQQWQELDDWVAKHYTLA